MTANHHSRRYNLSSKTIDYSSLRSVLFAQLAASGDSVKYVYAGFETGEFIDVCQAGLCAENATAVDYVVASNLPLPWKNAAACELACLEAGSNGTLCYCGHELDTSASPHSDALYTWVPFDCRERPWYLDGMVGNSTRSFGEVHTRRASFPCSA